MVPLALGMSDQRVRVSGVPGMVDRILDASAYEELLLIGSARSVEKSMPVDSAGPLVGAWIGAEFIDAVRSLEAPIPRFDEARWMAVEEDGWVLVDTAPMVYAVLDSWLRETFAQAIERRSEELAELMMMVLPERDETRAALWWASESDESRREELERWARLERDAGRQVSIEALMTRIIAASDDLWPSDEALSVSLYDLPLPPRAAVAVAVRCAERLSPLFYWPVAFEGGEAHRAAVTEILAGMRQVADSQSFPLWSHETHETYQRRLSGLTHLLYQVEPSRKSWGLLHPLRCALESALFACRPALGGDAEHAREPVDDARWALCAGIVLATYPNDEPHKWSFWRRAASIATRSVLADVDWLHTRERVTPAFYERDLWPGGRPLGWDLTIERHQERIESRFREKHGEEGG